MKVKLNHHTQIVVPFYAASGERQRLTLKPGDNQVDDSVWRLAKNNNAVKQWLDRGVVLAAQKKVSPSPEPKNETKTENEQVKN